MSEKQKHFFVPVIVCKTPFWKLSWHCTTSELWFGQEQEGISPELLSSSFIV